MILIRMAFRGLLRNKRRTFLTAFAMAIAVLVTSGMITFTEGMYNMLREGSIDRNIGHVQLHNVAYPGARQMYDTVDSSPDTLKTLQDLEGTTAVSSRLFGNALVGNERRTQASQLMGIDPSAEAAIRDLSERMTEGEWLSDEDTNKVVLGYKLATKLDTKVGDELIAYTQAADGSPGTGLYIVKGLVNTGIPALDRGMIFMPRADLGELLMLQDQAHEVVVLGTSQDKEVVSALQSDIEAAVGNDQTLVQAWWEVQPGLDSLFAMQGVTNGIMLFFFFGVGAIGVINTLLMSVLERTREFGVMRAIGMPPKQVIRLIFTESIALSVVSIVIGSVFAVGMNAYLIYNGIDFTINGEGYEMATMTFDPILKGEWTVQAFTLPAIAVLVSTLLAAIWPAYRAATVKPIDALRAE